MGLKTYKKETESPVPPKRLFKAFCLDSHKLFPKLLPQAFESVEFVEGDHTAVGCIKQVNFPAGHEYKYAKHRIDALDEANFYIKDTTIEGDVLGDKLEYIVNEAKYEVSSSGGSVCKLTTSFHTKGDAVLEEDKVEMGFEKMHKLFKAVEEYLIANPQAYA
uniref:Pathogenesis-related protein n=1 Tax=Tamarix hispida TaxID=189793 RepID=B7U9Z2_9CARY|nr:pathogenesis-related protein [Tamarix hispida]